MKKTVLKSFARLIARCGVAIQKGEEVRIRCDVDQPEFIALLTEEFYRAGASKVRVDMDYQPLKKLHVKYQTLRKLSAPEDWELARWEHEAAVLPASIYIISEDPDGLRGMNQEKDSKATQNRYKYIKPFRDRMENKYKWTIAAVPGKKWARKMFPGVPTATALEKQWQAILYTSRVVDAEGNLLDPIQEWEKHNADMHYRCRYLNDLQAEEIHFTAGNGTDLRVGLLPQALFCGGSELLPSQNVEYNPNIPSEECFTSPMKGKAEGIVYASKPLSYRGEIIDKFWMRFKDGHVVEAHAEVNDSLLHEMLSMDEGASYLGECALVPVDSPICQSGLLFYETLFDENASCHLAMGQGYSSVLKDFEKYTQEEAYAIGINDSMIHVDFMIGTPDLSVTVKTKDGRTVQVFKNGTWAF